ncbi:hypothetical protein L3V65_04160 [Heyndrickxia coagulans]|uniref:hypothetical protein n=1 Tax=Heyndrickxia coagulans TaxID=1398 RepID=UPI001F427019|nr:hypothetical protein [Heyndrickxia coagulans]UJZ88212.1 hypothetical protein L3V65_04160 [Heyndrickxia coagulans]
MENWNSCRLPAAIPFVYLVLLVVFAMWFCLLSSASVLLAVFCISFACCLWHVVSLVAFCSGFAYRHPETGFLFDSAPGFIFPHLKHLLEIVQNGENR